MLDATFYNFTQQTQGALYGAIGAARARLVATEEGEANDRPLLFQVRSGLAESPGWFMVQAAEFDPEPLTVERLRVRDVYASERIVQALLELLAGEQWLERAGETYHLTAEGRNLINRLRTRTARFIAAVDQPLPDEALADLASLLQRIIDASLKQSSPPGIWCLAHSRNRAPGADAPPLLKINQFFSDFNAFRDDAHMAAWQTHTSAGYAWEAFALLCDGQATSAADIFSQLVYRGFSRGEYTAALQDLVVRDWLTGKPDESGHYLVTETGRAIREEVEGLTDQYFYAPWSDLSEAEVTQTKNLLQQLHDRLQEMGNTPSG